MKYFIVFSLFINLSQCFFDPVTLGTVAGLAVLGYNFQSVKEATFCKFTECCIDSYIPANTNDLYYELKRNLFGQHIVLQQLIPALKSHLSEESKKPLVISFHGTPGTGKNYVADFIAKSLYKKGLESEYVHKFLGRSDFPLDSQSHIYKARVNEKIKNAIRKCPRSLFIFDEVDKMPPGIFEAITSLLDHHSHLNGVDYRKAIFIFLSNTAGVELSDRLAELMKDGAWRDDTKLHDFEKILEIGAYNLDGGLKKASMIEAHLIDHYIPFLPLEKTHVEQCLKAEYYRLGVNPTAEQIQKIIDNFVTFDKTSGLFATTGCKRLSKKVEVDVYYSKHK